MTVILVTGATGRVGLATLKALSNYSHLTVKAMVRDLKSASEKCAGHECHGVQLVQADGVHLDEHLHKAFAGINTVVIINPAEGRDVITQNYIAAAKAAGVKHAVVLSVAVAGHEASMFGRQFHMIEENWKHSGIEHTIVRLPLFLDNEYANVQGIKENSCVYYPVKAESKFNYIAVSDVGEFFAALATHAQKHVNQIYRITGPDTLTCAQLVQCYSEMLGKEVKFVHASNSAAIDAMCKMGVAKWQAEGVIELWRCIDEGLPEMTQVYPDFEKVTGKKPMAAKEWLQQMAPAFK